MYRLNEQERGLFHSQAVTPQFSAFSSWTFVTYNLETSEDVALQPQLIHILHLRSGRGSRGAAQPPGHAVKHYEASDGLGRRSLLPQASLPLSAHSNAITSRYLQHSDPDLPSLVSRVVFRSARQRNV